MEELPVRHKMLNKFIETLDEIKYFSKKEIEYISIELEKSCYNLVIKTCTFSKKAPKKTWSNNYFMTLYSTKCGSILSLLGKDSETAINYPDFHLKFIKEMKDYENFDFDKMVSQDFATVCKDSIEKEQEEINIRRAQKVKLATSTLFKCPKCKKKNCSYEVVQLRSLDEAPDYKCTCFECGNTFKGY